MCYQTVGHQTLFENIHLIKEISAVKLKFEMAVQR